ncbi:MAG TPA: HupE/UreJ family protein [Caulobacteraceae bacterium]|nr:HupE/UreJ family protein [Caulobacteraceae bacterium]
MVRLAIGLALWCVLALTAQAHEVRPALLQVSQASDGGYDVLWKQPLVGDMGLHLVPHLSGGGLEAAPVAESSTPGFLLRRWHLAKTPPLDGQTISIEGLAQSVTDVLVRIDADGRQVNAVVHPAEPTFVIHLAGPKGPRVPAYLKLGVEHILTGADHLAFVLGLILLIGPRWRVVKAVTAFTVAHSITLALAALGYVHFPSAVIEALVALSIVFVACELIPRPGRPESLTHRHPWLIAFVFGLLHGLAFAGALAEIGLPPNAEPLALFLFNVGVEIGQLMFIAVAITLILALRWLRPKLGLDRPWLASALPAYAVGGMAAYWLIDRLATAFA